MNALAALLPSPGAMRASIRTAKSRCVKGPKVGSYTGRDAAEEDHDPTARPETDDQGGNAGALPRPSGAGVGDRPHRGRRAHRDRRVLRDRPIVSAPMLE